MGCLVGDALAAIADEGGSRRARNPAAWDWDTGAGCAIKLGVDWAAELAARLCLGQRVGADHGPACDNGKSCNKN